MRVNENSETYKKLQIAIEALKYLSNPQISEPSSLEIAIVDIEFYQKFATETLDKIND